MNNDGNNANNSKIRNIIPTLFTWKSLTLKAPFLLISSMGLRALSLIDYCYVPRIQPIAQNAIDNQYIFVEQMSK